MSLQRKPMCLLLVWLLLLESSLFVTAFVPTAQLTTTNNAVVSSFGAAAASALEEDQTSQEDDIFAAYVQTADQRTVATKDLSSPSSTGSTMTPVVAQGQTIAIAYKGRLMATNQQFDESDFFVFKVGDKRVAPGLEKGVVGMTASNGAKRCIRVPPNLAFGDKWYKGTIPPSSHLEFDIEILKVAESPTEEIMLKVENFGVARLVGLLVCGGYLALSPFL